MSDGRKPVKIFIENLSTKMQVKAINSLEILEEKGNELREPYTKAVGNGIFELRIKFGSDITRIFYFYFVGKKIIVTNGIIKKTNKTPQRALKLAIKYKADYERRFCDE
jgi:phage-related protein